MLFFLSRNRKLISLFFIGLFFISSNNYGDRLLTEAVKIVIGITIDDYKCKDRGCGCDTAFKCLTNCCCSENEKEESIAVICNPITPVTFESQLDNCCSTLPASPKCKVEETQSCCSDLPVEQCCVEDKSENEERTFLPSKCSAEIFFSYQVSKGFLMDLSLDIHYAKEFYKEPNWNNKLTFSPQFFINDILKVPRTS